MPFSLIASKKRPWRLLIGEIGLHHLDDATIAPTQFFGERIEFVTPTGDQDHIVPDSGKDARQLGADSARGSGHHGPANIRHHALPCFVPIVSTNLGADLPTRHHALPPGTP